jgi:uncharacterized protein (TIGR02646 family)
VIKVKRTRPAPAVLASEAAKAEQAAADAHYGNAANQKKEFPFKAYQHPSVRAALEQLFRMKCAYCETKIGAADESEIEHWRPKGAVKEDDGRRSYPPYYWLAATWDNLLLSCLKCNRPRKYRIIGGDEDEETWQRSGKGMLFPLAEGDVRATKRGGEASEHPLLLDPCRDDPGRYLDFVLLDDDAMRKALIRPKGQRGRRRQLGERSIDVYSLNRPLLVDRRREELTQLQRHLADFKLALEMHEALPAGELRERPAQLMQSNVTSIAERLSPDSEYLLMAKQALADFLDANPAVRRTLERALRDARRTS